VGASEKHIFACAPSRVLTVGPFLASRSPPHRADFRGPNGVWTKQRRGQPLPKASVPFEHARPSLTHQALLALQRAGKLKYLVSQNVDSLHLRSGFPRSQIAELHGNCFAERCIKCKREYVRDFEVCSVGFRPTGRRCSHCSGQLHDNCLDWDDALPVDELELAEEHTAKADLALCLGTSLVIIPACDIPLLVHRKRKHKPKGGKLGIINLQATQHDKKAALVVHAKVDAVLGRAMQLLEIPIPAYRRTDKLLVSHQTVAELSAASGAGARRRLCFELSSVHGAGCPLPWLHSCEVSFLHTPDAPSIKCSEQSQPPWTVEIEPDDGWPSGCEFTAALTLTFAAGTTSAPCTIHYKFGLDAGVKRRRGGHTEFELLTCCVEYDGTGCGQSEPLASASPAASGSAASASNAATSEGPTTGAD
jgi:mono-ADP-ribosyltransferase sirtuin 6